MPMKIYKQGQGYWTRMLTALATGMLVLAGVVWLWQKLDVYQWDKIIFVQAGLAVVIIAVFGTIVFRWVGVKPKSVDFMIATEGEMKKVNWPTRKEVVGSTWVVICCVFLLVAVLLFADVAWQGIMRWTGVIAGQ